MANTKTTVDVPTNVGTITLINTSRRNRPAGLRKPWDYVMRIEEVKALVNEMKGFLVPIKELQFPSEDQKVSYPNRPNADQVFRSQYPLWKPRVSVFITDKLHIGASVHFSVETTSHVVTQNQWNSIQSGMQNILTNHMGDDAESFKEGYAEYIREPEYYLAKHNESEPSSAQFRLYTRFDSNIQFEETIPIREEAKSLFKQNVYR